MIHIPPEPWIQNNPFQTIITNLTHYLLYNNWFFVWIGLIIVLYAIYRFATKNNLSRNIVSYFMPYSNIPNEKTIFCTAMPIAAVLLYIINLFLSEQSLFSNVDLMSYNTVAIFNEGVTPYFGYKDRLSPWMNFDLNFLFAFTHNFYIINSYTVVLVILICILLYNFTNNISKKRRMVMIACCILLPSFFTCNSIVFPERMIIIEILLSFIFMRKYFSTHKNNYLLLFILLMNIAIYSKESFILIFFVIFCVAILQNIISGNLVPNDFIHPFKSARKFPLETMMFFSFLFFSITFLFVSTGILNTYTNLRHYPILQCIVFYKFEIILALVVMIFFIKSLFANKDIFLFSDGIAIGSILSIFFMIAYVRIIPIFYSYEHKTYYLLIPSIFCIIYIFMQCKSTSILYLLCFSYLLYAAINNFRQATYDIVTGKDTRNIAEMIVNNLEEDSAIYLDHNTFTFWELKSWSTAMKYYFPNKKITFKSARDICDGCVLTPDNLFHKLIFESPNKKDIILTSNTYNGTLIYENKTFKLYYNK